MPDSPIQQGNNGVPKTSRFPFLVVRGKRGKEDEKPLWQRIEELRRKIGEMSKLSKGSPEQ